MSSPTRERLYPLRSHPTQEAYRRSRARFNVVPAGRRSGKTELAKRKLLVYGLRGSEWPDARYFAAAPTRDQAKAIYWNDLKAMFPRQLVADKSESDLFLRLVTGTELWVLGMDRPERAEGRPWDGGVLDEFANMKPGAFQENIRPALSDRKGWCDLIGVPEGRNHYYDIWKYAISGVDPDWAGFTWLSADILDESEIASARRQLDPLVFQQEYEASFVNFEGRAYYPFLEALHAQPLHYDLAATIGFCFDFNVDPGVAAVVQEQAMPGQYERGPGGALDLAQPIIGTGVIGEVHIDRNSNTPAVCRKLIELYGKHVGRVICYGDATGGARGSAQVAGSDWELIKKELRPVFGDRLFFRVSSANPPERSRVNAVNSRIKAGDGTIRLMVDPARAPHVVKDLEGVRLLKGGSGEIDKRATPMLTHISDALGYYVEKEFPVVKRSARVMAFPS